jgi:(p)ppGpp synthase/HD superfamily hydrolase
MDHVLDRIMSFADHAHDGQRRKYTAERYIVHPVRVMEMCRANNASRPMLAAALLHDVLEDTPVSANELQNFLLSVMPQQEALQTAKLVEELTDVYVTDAYPEWNRKKRKAKELVRIAQTSADSKTIKYADVIDNCSEIVQNDPNFARRFLIECRNLLQKADKGNPVLYKQAMQIVDEGLAKLYQSNV